MEPILTYSEITGRVYIVTKYKRLDGGVIDTREKFDVTEWVEKYAKKRNAQTVEENAKLRELCIDFASMLTYAGLDGLSVEATIGGVTKTYDASELCDKVEEISDKED